MSNVIKLNKKGIKLNFRGESSAYFEPDEDKNENIFKQQLEAQYLQGYNDGQKDIAEALENNYSEKLAKKYAEFHDILTKYDERLINYETVFEKIVLDTAFIIAQRIVKRELDRESIISDVVRSSIKKIIGANEVVIKLNPIDYEEIMIDAQKIMIEHSYSKIKFESDESIEIGGCLIETEIGNVDSRISTQLEVIKQNLDSSLTPL